MIMNLRRIRCVGRSSVQLTDGTTLPLPRGAYEPLNRTIIDQTRLRMAGSRPAGCRKAVPGWTGQNAKEGHDVVSWAMDETVNIPLLSWCVTRRRSSDTAAS